MRPAFLVAVVADLKKLLRLADTSHVEVKKALRKIAVISTEQH